MPTLTPQQIAIQKKMLESNPQDQFGNQDYRGSSVGNATTPKGVSLAATIYPPTTDKNGKTDPAAQQMIDKINSGLQENVLGKQTASPSDDWFSILQNALSGPESDLQKDVEGFTGSLGGKYVPYSALQLAFEAQTNQQNQDYGNKYLDILSGKNQIDQTKADAAEVKAAAGTATQKKNDALSQVTANIQSWRDQGYTQAQVNAMITKQAQYLQTLGITPSQVLAVTKQIFSTQGAVKPTPGPPGPPGPPAALAPGGPVSALTGAGTAAPTTTTGLVPQLLQWLKSKGL
jgi:hypothetical protein